ncbi:MAG: hypothetical protein M3253_02700 [Chloroflexota bacterium]|nr:hypothetical protein [Chloroflexota bacterium]
MTTLEGANGLLAGFLARHNRRFAVPAREPEPAWRALPAGLLPAAVFCFHYPRRVANDATIGWMGEPLALPRRRDGRSWAGRSVILQERLDGSLWVSHGGESYAVRRAPADAGQLRARGLSRSAEGQPDLELSAPAEHDPPPPKRQPWKPPANHPWRRR